MFNITNTGPSVFCFFYFYVINVVFFPPVLLQTLKPLMEKRRRARINESLNKLKELIVPLVGKDVSRPI